MIGNQGGEPLAAERRQRDVGHRGHRLGRIGEGEQGQADKVALEVETHDLPAAIAEHDAGMEPALADDIELARGGVLADHHRAALAAPVLVLETGERLPLGFGQTHEMAEPLG